MSNLRLTSSKQLKLFVVFSIIFSLVYGVSSTLLVQKASAHGNVTNSRAALCASGQNTNCGQIIYEPYSLEGLKGFPAAGPPDEKIASANTWFTQLDQQSSTRWSKVNISPGPYTFNWYIKVPHATTSWKYYITKQNWDPNAPLTRASFDLTPFCSVSSGGSQPGGSYSDTCNIPSRSGYQVILAVWEIYDTNNAFYNVIDVNFNGNSDILAPSAPSSATSSNIGTTTATVSWGASTDNVGVSGYRVFNGSNQITTTNGALSSNLTGLTANTTYNLTVKAFDAAGNVSNASNTVTFTTLPVVGPDNVAPTAPSSLHVMGTTTSTSVPLMWNASTDNVGVKEYQIFRGSTYVATVTAPSVQYTVTGLTANTAYSFTVKALDNAGNVSVASNVLNVTTPLSPAIYPAWSATTVYVAGNKVTHNNVNYEAKWWTLNETPGTSAATVWKVIP
ncbi:lytic polysaccharide monooxygenase [Paenibacillus sp. GSMTC-2017]|uniref:lytic polysaccharide monooxygenase n=1 Tax=Paenibacillus sp. GSMTC-2017 TaxID=2794350 RepID=UPI0018D77839|nr:lytic polysaccharide monooxygenase [Paenibacillus sp. GSMTC-2017]MBH5316412.1 lytic polysaccharide monooxygenase [Paenibacillus sp. GSMTC-2017]